MLEPTQPPNNFRDISILPTLNDIIQPPFFRANLRDSPFDDLDEYLDIQFRLLREDCLSQLRSGIREYYHLKYVNNQEVRRLQDARLYKNVTLEEGKEVTLDGPVYTIKLDMNQVRNIRWERSKRMLYGSLLCILPLKYQALYFGIVQEFDSDTIKQNGTLKVMIKSQKDAPKLEKGMILTVVESEAYFEAYRHVLRCLQTIKPGELPFEKYIVLCHTSVDHPLYLRKRKNAKYDLQPIIAESPIFQPQGNKKIMKYTGFKGRNILRQNEEKREVMVLTNKWPKDSELHLDKSQYEAFKSALTKEFVLIQGPPGTGKTHLGLRIAKVLLHNARYWRGDEIEKRTTNAPGQTEEQQLHPMLIVCFTNHALDQFLEGIIDFMDPENRAEWHQSIVRVGGRSNSEKIEEFSLKNRRRLFRKKFVNHSKFQNELQEISKELCARKWLISCAEQNILEESVLTKFVEEVKTIPQSKKLEIMKWLKTTDHDLLEAAFERYEKSEDQTDTEENKPSLLETEELIDIETESDHAKNERMIEEDDFEMDYSFKEIGFRIEAILEKAKSDSNLTEEFGECLNKEALLIYDLLHKNKPMLKEEVQRISDVWNLPMQDRWRLYKYFVKTFCDIQSKHILSLRNKYDAIFNDYVLEKNQVDKEVLSSSLVIAMTTTGAARYQTVLNEIAPKIIIVEEAAEVLEAHIISTLSSQCEHLILIGDHKQLEPKPSVYELAEKYNLALSMFERMIENKLEFNCLLRQHRMRPEISQLVQDMYPGLENSDSVFNRDHVMGIEKDVFFVSHIHDEYQKGESQSYSNEFEARYVMRLTRYLLQQGYKRQDITVLTPYSGQMFCIRDLMPKSEFAGIRISILDNYQGEENEIILLSLVRSNKEGKIGFLKKENRICVALSRAKIGLYVIGNFRMIEKYTRKTHLLRSAIDKMKKSESLASGLPLYCQNHPSTQKIFATDPDDFDKAPEGGCSFSCKYQLKCGHFCTRFCHPYDKEHLDVPCSHQCEKVCERGHICDKKCHFPKPCRCRVKVKKVLECDHTADLPCFQDPDTYECLVKVKRVLNCGHNAIMHCYILPEQYDCQEIVHRDLSCGHSVDLKCHIDSEAYDCLETVKRTLPTCKHDVEMKCHENVNSFKCQVEVTEKRKDCEHNLTRKCYMSSMLFQVKNKCCEKVNKKLRCGHSVEVECHIDIKGIKCKRMVDTNFPCHHENMKVMCCEKDTRTCSSTCRLSCFMSHECSKPCHFPKKCYCEEIVEKTHPTCGHNARVKCCEKIEETKCFAKVVKTLPCGHKKQLVCHRDVRLVQCQVLVVKELDCGHKKEVQCHKDVRESDIQCTEKVLKNLKCGHHQDMYCYEDPVSKKCSEMVRKLLPCSHYQESECWRKIEEIKCETEVEKLLSCGHTANAKCYLKPLNIKCRVKVLKQLLNCSHSEWMECCIFPGKINCMKLVEYKQPKCNHVNMIVCHLFQTLKADSNAKIPECSSEVTKVEVCGHEVTNPCRNPKKNRCRQKCSALLACGHTCTGDCQKCLGGLIHQTCTSDCQLEFVCGHKCKSKRCGNCKPCDNQCTTVCSHRTCTQPCFKPCDQCNEPCDWYCPHVSCGLLCYEPCTRKRCNEQCHKLLHCGHKCSGICGEPCLCIHCNGHMTSKHHSKTGFVLLEGCGHIFHASQLDATFDWHEDVISALKCPRCKQIVTHHPRYNFLLKKRAHILNKINTEIYLYHQNRSISTFPALFGNMKECQQYITEFGTFLSATRRKLEKTYGNSLQRSNYCLGILKEQMVSDIVHNYQWYIDIYRSMAIINCNWKVLIIKLAENEDIENPKLGDSHIETENESKSTYKEETVYTLETFREKIVSLERLVRFLGEFTIAKQNEIEELISSFESVLSNQVKARIEKADNYPRPLGMLDCHLNQWTVCEMGKA